ncbi:MAG TPA: hypothetical protein VF828_03825 [Patescibacteria group bacterium]
MIRETVHPVDRLLNDRFDYLVNQGVISPLSRQKITPLRSIEFALRYDTFIRTGCFTSSEASKFQTMFGQPASQDFIAPPPAQIAKVVSDVFPSFQSEFPEVAGICLYGSRLDSQKTPRNKNDSSVSDLDFIPVFKDTVPKAHRFDLETFEGNLHSLITGILPVFRRIPVSAARSITVSEMISDLDPQEPVPLWTKDPEGIYFVGNPSSLHWRLCNRAANDRIRRILLSPLHRDHRRQLVIRTYTPFIPAPNRHRG